MKVLKTIKLLLSYTKNKDVIKISLLICFLAFQYSPWP